MEFLATNNDVLSVHHSQEQGIPAKQNTTDPTRVLLRAITKANIHDDVRVYLIEKFFEELGSSPMETLQREKKSSSPHFMDRNFQEEVNVSMNGNMDENSLKLQNQAVEEFCTQRKSSSISSPNSHLVKTCCKEGKDATEQGITSFQNILSLLKDASASGALVLKDADSVLQYLHKNFSEQKEAHTCSKNSGDPLSERKLTEKENFKERESDLCPKGLCPKVNNPCSVSNATAVSSKEAPHALSAYFQQKDNFNMAKDKEDRTLYVKELPCSSSHAIQNKEKSTANLHFDSREFHSSQASQADVRGAHVGCCPDFNKNNVNNASTSLNFLEAAKKAIPCSSLLHSEKETQGNGSQSSAIADSNPHIFKIDNGIFHKRMEMCKFSVIGKVTLVKGDEPWTWYKLKEKLDVLWGLKSGWRLISLGKGFFHIILTSQDELNKIWAKSVLHLKPGVLRIQSWNFGFDPSKEKTTRTQVWFRIFHLPWCLWDPSIINGIAQRIGVPLRIDKTTLEGNFGHYARVLVEVDISKPIMSSSLLECGNKLMEIKFIPENLPLFCKGCSSIGHLAIDCKSLNKMDFGISSSKPKLAETIPVQKRDLNSLKRESQMSEWRQKKVQVTGENSSTKAIPSNQSEKVSKGKNIVEIVTDFSAQFEDHTTKKTSSDCIIFSNQFSVLQSEDEVEEVVQNSEKDTNQEHTIPICNAEKELIPRLPNRWSDVLAKSTGSDYLIFSNQFSVLQSEDEAEEVVQESEKVTHQEPNNQLCEEDEAIIPKLPHRWSDVLDDEDENEKVFTLEEVNATIGMATSNFQHSFKNMSEFRAQLDEVWIDREDRFDRDMCVEIEPARISPKCLRSLITHFPKKDNKVKIGFRQPKRNIGPP